MGVTSRIVFTSSPAAANARIADSRPDPGPLTRTSTIRIPWSLAMLAAFIAACCAAKGVPLREPRKPSEPELFHETTLPSWSEMVTMVLLNEACTCTTPWGTCLRSFFLNAFFLPFFSGVAAPVAAFAIILNPYRAAEPARGKFMPRAEDYVFAAAFFLLATVPLRGPLRVRALVWVRWPRTGRLRRWRLPRYDPISISRL